MVVFLGIVLDFVRGKDGLTRQPPGLWTVVDEGREFNLGHILCCHLLLLLVFFYSLLFASIL